MFIAAAPFLVVCKEVSVRISSRAEIFADVTPFLAAYREVSTRTEMSDDMAPSSISAIVLPRVTIPGVLVTKYVAATTEHLVATCPTAVASMVLTTEYVATTTQHSAATSFFVVVSVPDVVGT